MSPFAGFVAIQPQPAESAATLPTAELTEADLQQKVVSFM